MENRGFKRDYGLQEKDIKIKKNSNQKRILRQQYTWGGGGGGGAFLRAWSQQPAEYWTQHTRKERRPNCVHSGLMCS